MTGSAVETGAPSDVQRAWQVFPAASNGEFNLPRGLSMVIERGEGCRMWTTDGREHLDFSMGWGSVLPGHAHPRIAGAVRDRAARGTNFAYTTGESLRLAEEIVRLSPACDRVRFCASGSEATMYCLRLARAFTGRPLVLKFEGAYHGACDEGVTSLFPSGTRPFPEPEPSSAGVFAERTLVAPFNDVATTVSLIEEHAPDLAAVIIEPFHRCIAPAPGFLEAVREATAARAVPLIFDEVVTGFRMAYGGAQERYGVVPDLVAYGKALGGGLPIGAFGGRAEIMDLVCEHRAGEPGYVWTASTLGGNPVSAAAANAALALYREPGTYESLDARGREFREMLRGVLSDAGHVAQVIGDGPLAQIVFSDRAVTDYRSTRRGDAAKGRAVMLGLVERGVFLNPMGTKLYLSLAHTTDACQEFCSCLGSVLATL